MAHLCKIACAGRNKGIMSCWTHFIPGNGQLSRSFSYLMSLSSWCRKQVLTFLVHSLWLDARASGIPWEVSEGKGTKSKPLASHTYAAL
jgi:hypothetical protein